MTHTPSDELQAHWPAIRRLCAKTLPTSFHFSMATVNEDGSPHVSPIGSLRLNRDCTGRYFEIFTRNLKANLDRDPRITIMAVDSGKLTWFKALRRGHFAEPVGVRLMGRAGPCRPSTDEEKAWWDKRVRFARRLKGYELLWGTHCVTEMRDLYFDRFEPINLGVMSQGHWSQSGASTGSPE